ncbi:flagellar basal body P-ring protein FlgI [Thermostilla marina]
MKRFNGNQTASDIRRPKDRCLSPGNFGWFAVALTAAVLSAGCSLWTGGKTPDSDELEQWAETSQQEFVGDLAVPFGLHPIAVESIGLVTGLQGTGGDPYPSPQRAFLLSEMQKRGVEKPNTVLASPTTAMVMVRGYLRPGIRKGDRFDIEVRIPSRSDTTSLRGGYLLETDLREMAVLGNAVRQGHVLGVARGPVLVDPAADPQKDHVYATRGVILGGGIAKTDRTLGLVLKPDHRSVFYAARIEKAINKRFYEVKRGIHEGIATAKTDEYVELRVPKRYANNVNRFMDVVRAIPLRDTEYERVQRLEDLRNRLLRPESAARAAVELEALGREAVDTLKAGLDSPDVEVRFYAAEALAYLDEPCAAEPLGEIARSEPAFRVFALGALSTLDDLSSIEQLHALLSVSSAETRYGAFRALWTLNPNDPLIAGEIMKDRFAYHVLDVAGPPMVHVTRSKRPEIVLFGKNQRLHGSFALEAGNNILVTCHEPGKVVVSRFAVGEPDQKRFVTEDLDEIIRAIVDLEGTYPDVVQMVQQAKASGALESRFEVDALPEPGRHFSRDARSRDESRNAEEASVGPETVEAATEIDAPDDTARDEDRSLLGWLGLGKKSAPAGSAENE